MQKNATPDLQDKKTPKESFVKQLIKNYEFLSAQNKKPKNNDKSPSERTEPKKTKP